MAKLLTRCPVCEAALGVSELSCGRCRTRIHGTFDPCRFCRLAPEHIAFLETFLRCEGNLSRVEKELGVSYPTVRNRFTAVLAALDFAGSPSNSEAPAEAPPVVDTTARRREILDALAKGTMSADEAANALRETA